jgi:hypothetical protein
LCAGRITVDAREKDYGAYDALSDGQVASSWATATLQEAHLKQCGILRSAFYQFFKTTLDIGICALDLPLLVPSVCFSNLTMPKDPDAHSTKTAVE